jgi:hypothetical protein
MNNASLMISNFIQITSFSPMCEHLQIRANDHRMDNMNDYQVIGHFFVKPYKCDSPSPKCESTIIIQK